MGSPLLPILRGERVNKFVRFLPFGCNVLERDDLWCDFFNFSAFSQEGQISLEALTAFSQWIMYHIWCL